MPHVSLAASIKRSSNLLTIKDNSSLTQTLNRIRSKNPDYVLIKRPNPYQMTGALLTRLFGKNFVWIQSFSNPPTPNILAKFLLTQPDRVVVKNKKDIKKLTDFGVQKSKIRYQP